MTDVNRIAGTVEVTYNGKVLKVVGSVSYNLGKPIRETLTGPDGVHGYKEMSQASFLEGEGRIVTGQSIEEILDITNATCIAKLATGKQIMIPDAHFEGEGTGSSEEATLPFKFVGNLPGKEIG